MPRAMFLGCVGVKHDVVGQHRSCVGSKWIALVQSNRITAFVS